VIIQMTNKQKQLDDRCVELGRFIVENQATVRAAAYRFGVSKSTVHLDVTRRLRDADPALYGQVECVLRANLKERAARGGQATRVKYASRGSQP